MKCDVAVVGLGSAGAAVAALCAERGLRVIGVEQGALTSAGATWMNGVPEWTFERAGLRPGPEMVSGPVLFHLVAGWDGPRVKLPSVSEVDMRLLSSRLQEQALGNGAQLLEHTRVTGRSGQTLNTSAGDIEAHTIVDASGYAGARLLDQAPLERTHLCTAAQHVYRVSDPARIRDFFAKHKANEGEVICFTGVHGGYSIVNVRFEGDHVHLLTGTIPALGHPSGPAARNEFVERAGFFGEEIRGGARAIPLRRAWEVIGQDGVALIGDAACQVHAAHGSGVGQQLVAARLLADTLMTGGTAWDYNVAWQRQYGAVLAGADLFRRFSQSLRPSQVKGMVQRGVLSKELMADALIQQPTRPPIRALLRAGRGMLKLPRVARGVVPVLARMKLLEAHYTRYPEAPSELPWWTRRLTRITGGV